MHDAMSNQPAHESETIANATVPPIFLISFVPIITVSRLKIVPSNLFFYLSSITKILPQYQDQSFTVTGSLDLT
jgi:uncharacterized membrane protein YadS